MATYNTSLVKAYLQAMQPMLEQLHKLALTPALKVPGIDTEAPPDVDVEQLVTAFGALTTTFAAPAGDCKAELGTRLAAIGKEQLLASIEATLGSSDQDLESALCDLLGYEELDLIAWIVQNRQGLETQSEKTENGYMSREEAAAALRETEARTRAQPLAPRSAARSAAEYPHVFRAYDAGNLVSATGKKYVLPVGTVRESHATHEEIVIPPPAARAVPGSDSRLVPLGELDFLCRGTFKGYATLNRMQLLVYPVAYHTNENMLVCAPTGAGKTDVAMLTVLHAVGQHLTETQTAEGVQVDIDYDGFKIVYVAPLKALASEIVEKMGLRMAWLGIRVRELTGDMQLTKAEIALTQMIVTTPEKWDVVTRKANGDNELVGKVKLLIIDEVHLLHEERGAVIETLVARTLRQVESLQSMIRIVGLSATLPNFMDVADFLRVNRHRGMFYFDQSFRPCPLEQQLLGVRGKAGSMQARELLDRVAYAKLVERLADGKQVMVFVHLRKDTVATARSFIQMAQAQHELSLFDCSEVEAHARFAREMAKNHNKDARELFAHGCGVHHAGMLRAERNLTERMFLAGAIRVLVCTATLAWGVNLPAAVVIVKGTQVYDPKRGGFVDLGISDVIQIFGRAGRPQFEKFGTGILCTTADRLDHYVLLLTQQHPIESRFLARLVDNLNAEVALGTVATVDEAVQWLGYTYMFVRMRRNPFAYGVDGAELAQDPQLGARRRQMVVAAARRLHQLQMVVFDERTLAFVAKDLGRVALDFYLLNGTVEVFNAAMHPRATDADVLAMLAASAEFDHIKVRAEETAELTRLTESAPCQIAGDPHSAAAKTNALLQAYVSRVTVRDAALGADTNYVAQNAARLCRALFFMALNRRWGGLAVAMLALCTAIDKRLWAFDHPMRQFALLADVVRNLARRAVPMALLRDMDAAELGDLVHNARSGASLYRLVQRFPAVRLTGELFPLTASVVRVQLAVEAAFAWDERHHGQAQVWWVFVAELEGSRLLHFEKVRFTRRLVGRAAALDFMIPLSDPLPAQVVVRAVCDTWLGAEAALALSFAHLHKPHNETLHTPLLKLQPLPVAALHDRALERLYPFGYFNPMQTMAFHTLYHTGLNVFMGSPTGLGKTVVAELAMWHAFRTFPKLKVVYIAPMKALVRERVDDWLRRLTGHAVVEMTGDVLPTARAVRDAAIIVTTPEKFDGILRHWQTRPFVTSVSLVIMDEIHLLASDRGPVLEMIVSRMNYMAARTKQPVRLLGMSTAVANAHDMAGWLGVHEGMFNFASLVRPVPLQMYIDGFQDNLAFCPLMKTMNKPAFAAIKTHSPTKPVLVFVASRRQTRLTALDLIHLCGQEDNPRRFLRMDDDELAVTLEAVKDDTLRLLLQFGIGLHHAGLGALDRQLAHRLFEASKIQILVATSTLAWGVNLPAHLVIIKGTQFFDLKIEGYRDMDLTDILQMMGRAGRPAFDTSGIAMVFTQEAKKTFYKHFLNVGFPVESSLHKVLANHLGAEIAAGTVNTRRDAVDFLSWTFLYRRAHHNPTYYGIEDGSPAGVRQWLAALVDTTITSLETSSCVTATATALKPTPFLKIASLYYLSHLTMRNLVARMAPRLSFRVALRVLAEAAEYDELPTRHGEELINMEMSLEMRYPAEDLQCEFIWNPHVKAFLLLQAYMSRVELPIADYAQDTVSLLDQALRVIQAYVDAAAELGHLASALMFVTVMQCVKQAAWFDDDPVRSLPGAPRDHAPKDNAAAATTLAEVGRMSPAAVQALAAELGVARAKRRAFAAVAAALPTGDMHVAQTSPLSLTVRLNHHNPPLSPDFKMHCPRFPKVQKESWFVIVADEALNELYVMKRASPRLVRGKGVVACTLDLPVEMCGATLLVIMVNDALDLRYTQMHTFMAETMEGMMVETMAETMAEPSMEPSVEPSML